MIAMKMLHNHCSPARIYPVNEPLTLTEAIKTYLAILFGVGICMVAFYYVVPF
jgi:hypothetical protein